jgi:hypothetical protein
MHAEVSIYQELLPFSAGIQPRCTNLLCKANIEFKDSQVFHSSRTIRGQPLIKACFQQKMYKVLFLYTKFLIDT